MREIFLKVINMNVLGSCFVLAVLFVRPFLKQASKNMICLLWLLAGIRFLVPFSVESSYGVFPNRTINEGIFYENNFTTETMEAAVIGKTTDQPAYRVYEGKGDSEKSRQMITICSYIWLSGVTCCCSGGLYWAALSPAHPRKWSRPCLLPIFIWLL